MPLTQLIQEYADAAPDLEATTVAKMRYEVQRVERLMGPISAETVSTELFTAFRSRALSRGLSVRSIEDSIATIRLLLATLNGVSVQPGRRLKRITPEPRPATVDELQKLWVAAESTTWPVTDTWRVPSAWWRAWLSLAYWTGLRLSDLTWKLSMDHWGDAEIRFRARKTRTPHAFPLQSHLAWIGRLARHGIPILHCGHSPTRLRNHLTALCGAAGIRRLTPKNLRQAAITAWTKADSRAGEIIHGCGLPSVLRHYIDPLEILNSAMPRVAWPFPEFDVPEWRSMVC